MTDTKELLAAAAECERYIEYQNYGQKALLRSVAVLLKAEAARAAQPPSTPAQNSEGTGCNSRSRTDVAIRKDAAPCPHPSVQIRNDALEEAAEHLEKQASGVAIGLPIKAHYHECACEIRALKVQP